MMQSKLWHSITVIKVFATLNTALAMHVQFHIKQALDSEIKGKGRMSSGLLLKPLRGLIKFATHSEKASFRKKWLFKLPFVFK